MTTKKTSTSPPMGINKIKTDIKGLDEVLNGGVAKGRSTLVTGGPGSGKSMIGLEFIYRGALKGEPGIFISFEERASAVRENAASMGWDLTRLENENKIFIMEARLNPSTIVSGDFNINGLLTMIDAKAKSMGADKITIDAVDMLMRYYDDPFAQHTEIYNLHEWLLDHKMTSLITLKDLSNSLSDLSQSLDYMTDCVINLDQRLSNQLSTRRLRILKYRGTGFGRNEYPFSITPKGVQVISSTHLGLDYKISGTIIPTDIKAFDQMLGGGFRENSTILIAGSSGTGKTTLGATFAKAAGDREEKTVYINFEESQDAVITNMQSPGISLQSMVDKGLLKFVTDLPESKGPEEHLVTAFDAIEEFAPRHIVVDAVSACHRMGGEKAAYDYLFRLIHYCKSKNTTCILINQVIGEQDFDNFSGIGISSLIDTVIFLKYIESEGEINRTICVMKSRGQNHSNQYREFVITSKGIQIQEGYIGRGGVLTGSARQEQEERDDIEKERLHAELSAQMDVVKQKEILLKTEQQKIQSEISVAKAKQKTLELNLKIIKRGNKNREDLRSNSN